MRNDKKRHTVVVLIAAVTVMLSSAYAFELLEPPRKWFQGIDGGPNDPLVEFLINAVGEESVGDADDGVAACQEATEWWEGALENGLNLLTTGTTSFNQVGRDDMNITSFNDPAGIVRGALAVSIVGWYDDDGETEPVNGIPFFQYLESDVSFSRRKKFTTSAVGNCSKAYDIQAIQAQEIGHSLGLDHSAIGAAIMFGSIGKCEFKTMQTDDHNAINTVYNPGFDSGDSTPCTLNNLLLTEHSCRSPRRGRNCLIITVGVSDNCGNLVNASVEVMLTGIEAKDVLTGTASTGNDGEVSFALRCSDAASDSYVSEVISISGESVSWDWVPNDLDTAPNLISTCMIRPE